MELEMQSSSLLNERSNDDVTAASCSDLADVVTDSTSKVFVDSDSGVVDEEVIFPSKLKKKKHFAVYDSDDDNEKPVPRPFSDDENQQPEPLLDEDSSQKHVKVKKSRIKPVWDSEEENENSADCTMKESLSSNLSNHSNDEDNSNSHSTQSSEYKKKKKEKSDIFEDTLSENVNDGNDNQMSRDKPTWLSGEDSDSDANEGFSAKSDKKTDEKILKTPKEKRTPREGMEKIYSESQRMVRESSVCLPYHKPKQRSLLEFLNRKRVTPSSEDRIKPRPRDSSAAVVQVLEERAKEIEEFFKSDSEESENDEKRPSLLTNDKESLLPKQDCKQQDLISDATENQLESIEIPLSLSNADSQPMPQEMQEITNDWNQDMDICQEENVNKITNQPMPHQIDNEIEKDPTLLLSEQSNDSWQDLSSAFSHKDQIENIKRLSIAKVSKPTLHGRPGQLLDLDVEPVSTEQKAKVNSLIDRFVQQVTATKKSPKKKDVQISIVHKVMNADGQLELKRDIVNVPADNSSSEGISASAGRRQLLKDSLRQSMSAKRAVDRMKKIELQKVENEDYQSDKMDSEPEEEILSDEPETDIDEDDEDERLYREKRKKLKNIFVENEAEHSGESEDDDDEDDLATRIVHSDSSDEDDIIDREPSTNQDIDGEKKKDHRTEESTSTKSDLKINFKGSGRLSSLEDLTPNLEYDSSQDDLILKLRSSHGVDNSVDELLALCSGKFTGATPGSFKTQNSLSQSNVDDEYEEEPKSFSRIVPMADDDDDSNGPNEATNFKMVMDNDVDGESVHAPVFSDDENGKSKPKRKKRSRICLSDDEDGNDDATSIVDEEDMHEEEREFRGLTDFFEDEAELSGSEVGSGDEREDDEDHWEEEEGDKEDIDENEVREQVGRAHMKTLLDQDQRDVRLFQELFLEDGDLHSEGGGRQRQFRWKNADGEDLEGEGVRANTQEDEIDAGADDQDDLTWRKMRSEREKWLQQQKSNQETKVDVPLVMKRNGKTVKVNTTPKLSVNHSDKTDSSTSVTALQTASPKKNKTITTLRRGSFLRRSEKDLSALASMTKSSALPVNAPKTGSNFVFASITPERPVEEKRKFKQEGSKAEPSNQNPAPAKKAKVCLNAKSIFSLM